MGGTRRGGPDVNIKHSGREDNERERERYRLEREREDRRPDFRERPDRFNRRSRSPRIRERERDRRSRSRDRKKRRSRSREEVDRRDRDRSDRREKEKKRKRSRSRDRDRSERKRDKRDKERDHRDRKERKPDFRSGDIKIKEEPVDGECNFHDEFCLDCLKAQRKLLSMPTIQNILFALFNLQYEWNVFIVFVTEMPPR